MDSFLSFNLYERNILYIKKLQPLFQQRKTFSEKEDINNGSKEFSSKHLVSLVLHLCCLDAAL